MRTPNELKKELGIPLHKGRRYISDPSKAPEGANVRQGKKGGYYYETAPSKREQREAAFAEQRAEREQTTVERSTKHEEFKREQAVQNAKKKITSEGKRINENLKNMSPLGRRAHKVRYSSVRDEYMLNVIRGWKQDIDPPEKEVRALEVHASNIKRQKTRIKNQQDARQAGDAAQAKVNEVYRRRSAKA